MPDITYRPAERGDIELIMKFIRDLAEYEKHRRPRGLAF